MTDIEARARAYGRQHYPFRPNSDEEQIISERVKHYLAGASAEVELEKKRIFFALLNLSKDEILDEDILRKTIEGDA